MSKILFGKEVYTELEEMALPGRVAILVVDMQNEFCHADGEGAKRGRSHAAAAAIIPRLRALLEAARATGIPVIYLMNTHREDGLYYSPAELARRMKKSGGDPLIWTIDGSWGHRIVDELTPHPSDIIVRKHRPSGFHQTDLEMILRNLRAETVVITGVGTRGCVESTARDAQSRDFYILIPEDTTASQRADWYQAEMLLMRSLYHWIGPSVEIEAVWKRHRETASR